MEHGLYRKVDTKKTFVIRFDGLHTSEERSLEVSPNGRRFETLDLQTASRLRGCARKLDAQVFNQKVEAS